LPVPVIRHARWLLAAVAVITTIAVLQLVDVRTGAIKLQTDPSVERLLVQDGEACRFYRPARRVLGSDVTIRLFRPEQPEHPAPPLPADRRARAAQPEGNSRHAAGQRDRAPAPGGRGVAGREMTTSARMLRAPAAGTRNTSLHGGQAAAFPG